MKTLIVIALAMVAAGCGSLTETSASQILASNLASPASAQLLANSVVADFECAYADYATATGIVSDELANAQLEAIGWDYDRRTLTSTNSNIDNACAPVSNNPGSQQIPGVWLPLSTARYDGDHLLGLLNGWTVTQVPTRVKLIGQTAAYTGYALTLMGETMCAGAIDGGPQITPDSLLGLADAHFTLAITNATAANDPTTLQMALLGRARERLDRGQAANAKVDAQSVDPGFVKNATYDATGLRRENRLYTVMNRDYFYSVQQPFWHVTFAGVPDTIRVKVDSLVKGDGTPLIGQDNSTQIRTALKFPTVSTPIAIARGTEALLIIAEADNDAGATAGAVSIINTLHTSAGLPPYASVNKDSVQAQIVFERASEFFLEGHRLADIIRYKLPLNPPAGTPFYLGGTYGSQLCFPLPITENGK
ncbi:MAG TPA: RagB/SusD family nutrient uptake outer membrane protein [Gemmatimonadaceae bacterium]|nr:RagB/SusD family nutrient uptake outer membrane protein [Gemmatimonadaceae bacterium]